MNNIKLKHNIKKSTRKEAYTLATELLKAMQNNPVLRAAIETATGQEVDDFEALFKYFLPAIPKKAKTLTDRVAKFCGTNDVREAINYIHVLDGQMVGCDGHIGIRAKTDLPDGVYEPKSMSKVDGVDNWVEKIGGLIDTALRATDPKYMDEPPIITVNSSTEYTMRGEIQTLVGHDGYGYSKALLDRATNGVEPYTIRTNISNAAVIDDGTDAEIIIMPMRIS